MKELRFPNAKKGISKIFTSEILQLLVLLATGITAILYAVSVGASKGGNEAGAAASGIGLIAAASIAGVLGIIALVLMIVGTVQASKDEPSFKAIIYLTVFNIIVAVIASVFSNNAFFSSFSTAISDLVSFVCSLLVVLGVANIAVQLNNTQLVAKCGKIFKILLCIGILSLLTRFFSIFIASTAAQVIVITLTAISLVLGIAQYIIYLSMLSSAKKMLSDQ